MREGEKRDPVRAVFLDRDNTINLDLGYTHKICQLQLLEGVADFLKKLSSKGYFLFVVTNQSGIGRGFYGLDDARIFNEALNRQLGSLIQEFAICPHRPNENCPCRKPKPKMINDLLEKYGIDPKNSFMIGDKKSDLEAGRRAGLTGLDVAMGYRRLFEKIRAVRKA